MKKVIVNKDGKTYECTVVEKSARRSASKSIYNFLDGAEKVAVAVSQINKILRGCDKAQKKRLKKYGKLDKKTGMLVLDRCKPLARATTVKRRKLGN